MQVVVIGAGLLGLSTAYALQQDGHRVCVVDASDGPARETSFANAGMLSPSLTDPWNSPGVFLNMLRWIGREDAPFLLRPRALPSLLDWGTRFFWQSRRKAFLSNWAASLELGLYSMRVQEEWIKEGDFQFQAGRSGILKIFRDQAELEDGLMRLDFLTQNHIEVRRLDTQEILEIEPSLEAAAPQLSGAILHTIDGHGDAHLFCREMERVLRASGATFHYQTRALGFEREQGRIRALNTNAGTIEGEAFVLAAAAHSVALGRSVGIRLPIRPAKGYSITLDLDEDCEHPSRPVVDDSLHIALTPLGERLRVAGTAEFTGFDERLTQSRIRNLTDLLGQIYPRCAQRARTAPISPWCGFRPMSPDGAPLLGRTHFSNLFLNTGHGPLGWTLCAGSGRLVADVISGRAPALSLDAFSLDRFRLT
ncbi:MAG: D-amino acid dehydrogenase [Myxococcota bacterium]|nr:D-amino acid dehydrogenase [Myxococcota bacterium]